MSSSQAGKRQLLSAQMLRSQTYTLLIIPATPTLHCQTSSFPWQFRVPVLCANGHEAEGKVTMVEDSATEADVKEDGNAEGVRELTEWATRNWPPASRRNWKRLSSKVASEL